MKAIVLGGVPNLDNSLQHISTLQVASVLCLQQCLDGKGARDVDPRRQARVLLQDKVRHAQPHDRSLPGVLPLEAVVGRERGLGESGFHVLDCLILGRNAGLDAVLLDLDQKLSYTVSFDVGEARNARNLVLFPLSVRLHPQKAASSGGLTENSLKFMIACWI